MQEDNPEKTEAEDESSAVFGTPRSELGALVSATWPWIFIRVGSNANGVGSNANGAIRSDGSDAGLNDCYVAKVPTPMNK